MMKNLLKYIGVVIVALFITVALVIIMTGGTFGLSEMFIVSNAMQTDIAKQVPVTATPNSHQISEMQYAVDDVKAQFSGLDTWLKMAAENQSLYIYATWQNQLNHTIAKITMDFEEIERLLPTGESEKKASMNEVRARYFEAAGLIFAGISQSDQGVVDEGRVIISELKVRIEDEWNWK